MPKPTVGRSKYCKLIVFIEYFCFCCVINFMCLIFPLRQNTLSNFETTMRAFIFSSDKLFLSFLYLKVLNYVAKIFAPFKGMIIFFQILIRFHIMYDFDDLTRLINLIFLLSFSIFNFIIFSEIKFSKSWNFRKIKKSAFSKKIIKKMVFCFPTLNHDYSATNWRY